MSISAHRVCLLTRARGRRTHSLILVAVVRLASLGHAQMEIGTVAGVVTDPKFTLH